MKDFRRLILTLLITTFAAGVVAGQSNKKITADSIGPLRINMSLAKARKALKPLVISKEFPGFEGEVW
ncbi:MAG TPA: hypothetical protein PKO33_00415 [Pyrinomonadaceae bacterium]|nr:hypothetical protein [Pyrinomonadaceae bacterium]